MNASVARTILSVCALGLAAPAPVAGVITVPPGFAVDQLTPLLDGTSPRLEASRNPAYGGGVFAASITNGILTVRRITQGNVEVFAVVPGLSNRYVVEIRFDWTGLFGNKLFVSVAHFQNMGGQSTLIQVEPDGSTSVLGTIGSSGDNLAMRVEFTDGSNGYAAGAYLLDENGLQGSSVWSLTPPATFTRLAQNSVAAGRSDMDVNGIEFDRTGAFGGGLFLSEGDINQSALGAVFRLSPALVWSAFTPQMNFNTRYFRDLAISQGGAFGQFIYVTEAVGDAVGRVATDASYSVFATGFDIRSEYDNAPLGAASITVTDDGNTLYVSDTNGVWRIRETAAAPGPQIIAQQPAHPAGLSLCGPLPVSNMRIIFSEPVQFAQAHVTVTNSAAQTVPSVVSGSGSQIMLVSFAQPLYNDTYTITVLDSVVSVATMAALDGDRDGIAGGNAVLTLAHAGPCGGAPTECCEGDANNDGTVDFADITTVLNNWLLVCPAR